MGVLRPKDLEITFKIGNRGLRIVRPIDDDVANHARSVVLHRAVSKAAEVAASAFEQTVRETVARIEAGLVTIDKVNADGEWTTKTLTLEDLLEPQTKADK